jgi:hypothetical protein
LHGKSRKVRGCRGGHVGERRRGDRIVKAGIGKFVTPYE